MKRSEYACAELEIVYINAEDVIATSLGEGPSDIGNGNEFGWGDF